MARMTVELIVTGIQNNWSEFTKYLGSEDKQERRAAIRCSDVPQLQRAMAELELDNEKLVFIAQSLGYRLSRDPTGEMAEYANSDFPLRKKDEEYSATVQFLYDLIIQHMDDQEVRIALFKAVEDTINAEIHQFLRHAEESRKTLFQIFLGPLKEGLKKDSETASLCAKILSTSDEVYDDTYVSVFGEKAVLIVMDGLTSVNPKTVQVCAGALETLADDRDLKELFSKKVVPALEKAAERLRKVDGCREIVWELQDVVDLIQLGKRQGRTEYRKYLGDDRPLSSSPFAGLKLPSGKPKKQRRVRTR